MTTFQAFVKDGRLVVMEREILKETRRSVTFRQREVGPVVVDGARLMGDWLRTVKVDKWAWRHGDETPEGAVKALRAWAVRVRSDAQERLRHAEDVLVLVGEMDE